MKKLWNGNWPHNVHWNHKETSNRSKYRSRNVAITVYTARIHIRYYWIKVIQTYMQIEWEVTAVKQNDDIVQRMFVLLFFSVFAESPAKSSTQSVHVGKHSVSFSFNQSHTASEPVTSKIKPSISHFYMNAMTLCICGIPLIPNHMSPRDLHARKGSILVGIVRLSEF